jgi:transcriptional regulator with XRE-family HTH domain
MTKTSQTLQIDRLSDFIKARRLELNLTQSQLVERMGLRSPEFIHMLENNLRKMDLNRIPLLADALQVDRGDLTRIAMREYYPLAHLAIFGSDDTGEIRPASKTVVEQDLTVQKLYGLRPRDRQTVRAMIESLYAASTRQ